MINFRRIAQSLDYKAVVETFNDFEDELNELKNTVEFLSNNYEKVIGWISDLYDQKDINEATFNELTNQVNEISQFSNGGSSVTESDIVDESGGALDEETFKRKIVDQWSSYLADLYGDLSENDINLIEQTVDDVTYQISIPKQKNLSQMTDEEFYRTLGI